MTKDPARLLSLEGGAETLERELLASVQRVDVPEHAKQIAWERIAAGVAAGAAGTAAATSVSALGSKGAIVTTLSSPIGKLVLAIALVGASGGGALLLREHASSPPPMAAAIPELQPIAAKSVPAALPPMAADSPALDPEPSAVKPAPRPHHRSRARIAHRDSRLAAESALLQDARARLRDRDVDGAAQALAQLQHQFADGVLKQEREVLAIELFQARGQTDSAERAARAFIANYPNSPHCASLRQLLSGR
ncbi:MAG TPA: hypothetical protein VGI70_13490 [Polyangiales bacterium]